MRRYKQSSIVPSPKSIDKNYNDKGRLTSPYLPNPKQQSPIKLLMEGDKTLNQSAVFFQAKSFGQSNRDRVSERFASTFNEFQKQLAATSLYLHVQFEIRQGQLITDGNTLFVNSKDKKLSEQIAKQNQQNTNNDNRSKCLHQRVEKYLKLLWHTDYAFQDPTSNQQSRRQMHFEMQHLDKSNCIQPGEQLSNTSQGQELYKVKVKTVPKASGGQTSTIHSKKQPRMRGISVTATEKVRKDGKDKKSLSNSKQTKSIHLPKSFITKNQMMESKKNVSEIFNEVTLSPINKHSVRRQEKVQSKVSNRGSIANRESRYVISRRKDVDQQMKFSKCNVWSERYNAMQQCTQDNLIYQTMRTTKQYNRMLNMFNE